MAIIVHPRILRGGAEDRGPSRDATLIRALVYAPSESRAAWIETELEREPVMVQIAQSIEHAVSALIEDPPPRPQVLIADFDDMTPGELFHLHVLREQGWFGRIIALGDLPPALCSSLTVDHVLPSPLAGGALRSVIASAGFIATTTCRMPVL
jgi:hypothetical protein